MAKQENFIVRKVAVLGAGVMGAQIAAHLASAKVITFLFDLAAKEGGANSLVNKNIQGLKKLKPSPLAVPEIADSLIAANYDDNLEWLKECDLIIEAIAERLDWKEDLYKKIAPYVNDHAIIATNTSGLSVNKLVSVLPKKLHKRFVGLHFFNPPRYMHLAEIIPSDSTDAHVLDQLETFAVSTLGKGVVRAKDTPNFIANRVGVFSMLATMYHAERMAIPFEIVDGLTGPLIGRAKSATFRTSDVVGLDTLAHVVGTMTDNLKDDPWAKYYTVPSWLKLLIDNGALGQKTRVGIFKKVAKEIQVLDIASKDYRPATGKPDAAVVDILKIKDLKKRFTALQKSEHPQAQFLWACFRDLFHYCAVHLESIANNARDVDLALRWGFGWKQGPFELWQSADWQTIVKLLQADIDDGKAMSKAALPAWVTTKGRNGVYKAEGAYVPSNDAYQARSSLPVYKRQLFPDPVLGEQVDMRKTVFETDHVRLWHGGDDIAVLSFKSKMNTIGDGVLDGILQAAEEAESKFKGLVVWQTQGDHFSVGANLQEFGVAISKGQADKIEAAVAKFQRATSAMRYAMVPTVAAVKGYAFGGGCELAIHCDAIVAALETYVGLVEVGVGLLPAGGGTKELALRAAQASDDTNALYKHIEKNYQRIAMAQVSGSGEDARSKGFLRPADSVIFNAYELLYVAKQRVHAMAESAYRPPLPPRIPVAGKAGAANLKAMLVNMLEGHMISEYDYFVGSTIADVICGGEIEQGSIVDEAWLLRLEREGFVALAMQDKTRERIEHMLKTGKPLRN